MTCMCRCSARKKTSRRRFCINENFLFNYLHLTGLFDDMYFFYAFSEYHHYNLCIYSLWARAGFLRVASDKYLSVHTHTHTHISSFSTLFFFITNTETRLPAFFFILMSSVLIAPPTTRSVQCVCVHLCVWRCKNICNPHAFLEWPGRERKRERKIKRQSMNREGSVYRKDTEPKIVYIKIWYRNDF